MKYVIYQNNRTQILNAITGYLSNLGDKVYQVSITDYDDGRSAQQNRLYYKLLAELASNGDMTLNEYRAHSKLHIGVPIMRQDDDFRAKYDAIVKPLDYQTKLGLMLMDFPVTSLMTVEQMQQFIDQFYTYWSGKGFVLTTTGE